MTTLGNFTIQGGMTRGWDNWDDNNNDLGFVGGIHWKSKSEQTKVAFCIATGREQPNPSPNVRTVYSLVLEPEIFERWHYVLTRVRQRAGRRSRRHHGRLVRDDQYLYYTINDSWKAGMRFEWFNDCTARSPATPDGRLFRAYLGPELEPSQRVLMRPEIRWD